MIVLMTYPAINTLIGLWTCTAGECLKSFVHVGRLILVTSSDKRLTYLESHNNEITLKPKFYSKICDVPSLRYGQNVNCVAKNNKLIVFSFLLQAITVLYLYYTFITTKLSVFPSFLELIRTFVIFK